MDKYELKKIFEDIPIQKVKMIKEYVKKNYISKEEIKEQINWLKNDVKITKEKITKGRDPSIYNSNYINDYRKARLRAYNTKSSEIIRRLEKLLEE